MLFFVQIPEQVPKPKASSVFRTLPSKLDLIGFALFAPAAIQLLLALQYGGNQFAWNSSTVIGLFCGAGATFLVFLAWDYYKGDEAMIPISMIRRRIVWSSCLVFGFLMSQLFTTSYYLPIYFQAVKGATPTLSGVYILPSILGQLFLAIGCGQLGKYWGSYGTLEMLTVGQLESWATISHLVSSVPSSSPSVVVLCPHSPPPLQQEDGSVIRSS